MTENYVTELKLDSLREIKKFLLEVEWANTCLSGQSDTSLNALEMCALIARVRVDDLCAVTLAVVGQIDAYRLARYNFPSCHWYSHADVGIPVAG